ncbi:MAG: FHA domain-containing protein [Gammaproteobacteria bacterium]
MKKAPAFESETTSPELRLCVMTGAHRGASCDLGADAFAVIGQRDDCDIILSDSGVAPHHVIVSTSGGRLLVRAVDGMVMAGNRSVEPGEPQPLDEFVPLHLTADVSLLVGEKEAPQWSELLRDVALREIKASPPPPRRWPVASAAMFAIAACATTAAMMLRDESLVEMPARITEVIEVVGGMTLPEVRVSGQDGDIKVVGVVRDAERRGQLQDSMATLGVGVELNVRTGDEIATDVREVLRMSGFGANTRYLGKGEVAVSGTFGDEHALARVLDSRSVRDVVGLAKIAVQNASPAADQTGELAIPKTKKIVSVVRGDDPYVVTADGSRYYVGALLPGGSRLHDITSDAVWVLTDGDVVRLDPELTHVHRSIVTIAGQDPERSIE